MIILAQVQQEWGGEGKAGIVVLIAVLALFVWLASSKRKR